jgi:hypothetical protein
VATPDETLAMIARERLYESGCGAVDVSLLASVLLTSDAQLWTLDKKLATLATQLGACFRLANR